MRLSQENAATLPAHVIRPAYDRTAQARGIVHFGLGAFTRAHQAVYADSAMGAGDAGWMITGVSMRSASVAEQLNPQDGLYLVAQNSGDGTSYRLGGAIRNVLTAPEDPEAVIAAVADEATRIVSFTVTEKGYCRAPDGSLDMELADGGFYPLLAQAFARRRDAGLPGLTLLSCDNLAGNGEVLGRLMQQYLASRHHALTSWFDAHCTTPSTMVDRIVPATTDADRTAAEAATGLRDEGLVVTEPFSQWVIEDRFANGRPAWENTGAQMVEDVAPFEMAKLRMLNGAHSLLAYCGLGQGFEFVHEAVADPALRALVLQLMIEEAIPTIPVAPGLDLEQYAHDLIARFDNPALNHRLAQIAMDGSQKIPQRWLETAAIRQARGEQTPAILQAIRAWIRHMRGHAGPVSDPLAGPIGKLLAESDDDDAMSKLFGKSGLLESCWWPETAAAG